MIIKWLQSAFLGGMALILIQCTSLDVTQSPVDSLISATNEAQDLEIQPNSDSQNIDNPSSDPPMTPTDPHPVDSRLQGLIDSAKVDLAQHLSISVSKISVLEAKEVVWPDSSLGCPQPGMKYKQVPEDGALIRLQVDGVDYNYHTGGSRGLFLCEKVLQDPVKPTPIDLTKLTPGTLDKNTPPSLDNSIPPGEDQ
jgi:hypothetical protein